MNDASGLGRAEHPDALQSEQQEGDHDDRRSLDVSVIPTKAIDQQGQDSEIDQVPHRIGGQIPPQGGARGAAVSKGPAAVDHEGLQDSEQVKHRHAHLGFGAKTGRSEVQQVEYDIRPDAGQGVAKELAGYWHANTSRRQSAA